MTTRLSILVCLALGCSLTAQEGHPLTGTWAGDWGAGGGPRTHVTVVMSWDGKDVTGTINPGPDAIPITRVALDVTNWGVRIEATARDKAPIVAEGRIDDLGSTHRRLTGTWSQGTMQGELRLTRE